MFYFAYFLFSGSPIFFNELLMRIRYVTYGLRETSVSQIPTILKVDTVIYLSITIPLFLILNITRGLTLSFAYFNVI